MKKLLKSLNDINGSSVKALMGMQKKTTSSYKGYKY